MGNLKASHLKASHVKVSPKRASCLLYQAKKALRFRWPVAIFLGVEVIFSQSNFGCGNVNQFL